MICRKKMVSVMRDICYFCLLSHTSSEKLLVPQILGHAYIKPFSLFQTDRWADSYRH